MLAGLLLGCGAPTPDVPTPTVGLAPPEHGVQLKVAAFSVPRGTEVQHCYYFKLPSDVDVEVTRIEVAYRKGSHHMNLFRTRADLPDHDEECFKPMNFTTPTNPDGVDLVVGSQKESLDWKLPTGVAFKLKAHQQLILQTHYVNASTQAGETGEVWVNLHTAADPKTITAHVGTMFANNMTIRLPPKAPSAFTTGCAVPHDVNVLAVTGHFHSRGKKFTVAACPTDMRKADAAFYESDAWDAPPFKVLDKPVALKTGGGLEYICEFFNDTDREIKFGPKVETDEHCNLFAYIYPWEDDNARYCF